jgi:hypothetical protein
LFIKGSKEDQQLKVVAEDVAASVLHPCAPSNPSLQAGDVSRHENIEEGDVQNNLIDAKCRDITQVILFINFSIFFIPFSPSMLFC